MTTILSQTISKLRPADIAFWNRLRWNLVIYFFILAIVPVSIVTTFTVTENIDQDNEQISRQLDSIAELKIGQIQQWLDGGENATKLILANPDLRNELTQYVSEPAANVELGETINENLLSAVTAHDTLNAAFVYDANQEIVAASDNILIGRIASNQIFHVFNDPEKSKPQIIPPSYQVGQNELAIFVVQNIFGDNNQVIGTLVTELDLETLGATMANRAGLPTTGETYLVSRENNYLLTPSRNNPLTRAYRSTGIDSGLNEQNITGQFLDYRGVKVIGSYTWVPELQAVLVAEVEESEAFANSIAIRNASIAITAGAITVAIVVGFFYAGYVARPIISLTHAASAVATGDYTQYVELKRSNEIGQLGNAFNSMTSQLKRTITDLQDLNRNLETRVASRTRDLELAAEVSREATSVMDHEVLLPRVANLTKEAFDLYHVSIFVLDETETVLHLEAGTGTAGDSMKQRNKRFNIDGVGLVPKAARERQAVVVNNTKDSDEHFQNPLLPNTQAEIALPMIAGDNLIGVLDLQSEEAEHFTTDDLRVLQTLADRIAASIRNAQLYTDSQKAKEHAEQSDKVKSMFLAAMSHELRTPLNAIINFSQFIALGMFGEINGRQYETINSVIESAEHLLNLINDVLDISKIESGSLKLFVENEIDVQEIVDTAVNTGRSLLGDKEIELRVNIDDDLPLISGDRQRITQIMLNILSNACKFTKEGHITINAQRVGDYVEVSISDTGPGIAPEDHERVFEKFKQTNTGLRQGGGTGLGMPITKSLVEAHGGQLLLESVPGEGTTFTFTVPVENAALVEVEVI